MFPDLPTAARAVLIGLGATLTIDLWALRLRRGFGIPSLSFCLLGRWVLHMPSGRFVHASIGAAALALILGAAGPLRAQAPGMATLTVTITGVRAEQGGELVVALYDRESAWLSTDSARAVQRLVPAGDSAVAVFPGLPFDSSLAVAVIHDRNGNGRMDMRWFPFPKPKEGAGVSRNHQRMGKPRYADAVFTLYNAEEAQRIALRY